MKAIDTMSKLNLDELERIDEAAKFDGVLDVGVSSTTAGSSVVVIKGPNKTMENAAWVTVMREAVPALLANSRRLRELEAWHATRKDA